MPPEEYQKILATTACAVGNSSSFVRDAGYFGTPVVLIGRRQEGRETDVHVTPVVPDKDEVVAAIRTQLLHGPYPTSALYGDGFVSQRIADALAQLSPYIQKRLHYIYQPGGNGSSNGGNNGNGEFVVDRNVAPWKSLVS